MFDDDEWGDTVNTPTWGSNGLASRYSPSSTSIGVGGAYIPNSMDLQLHSEIDNLTGYNRPTDMVSTSTSLPAIGDGGSFMDGMGDFLGDAKGLLSDKDFMSGMTSVGEFGLGLANYFAQKPVLDAQLNALKQNTRFAAEDQARRDRTAANFDRALS